ncbi:Ger(x)C family spore germination protein [Priestia aryabhattai]|uniref:Ger(x)C family spore germination protein n=1 Tax=Priestia aryabhattai TaxID=412384 RepID=UPI001875D8B4|nr:Ger(x)C family spore germination protein [Priestia aryabhattai]MBE5100304.1 Ger(x)C family spore germination protein [Priestia aryabhattai]
MKWLMVCLFLLFIGIMLSSPAGKPLNLEDVSFSLVIGMDLDDENNLMVYTTSPVFKPGGEQENKVFKVNAKSVRQSREEFDSRGTGLFTASKAQVLLVGQKLLENPRWFSLIDVLYKDFKTTVNSRIVAIDGPVSNVMNTATENQPINSMAVKSIIDTSALRGETVKVTLQELHRQMFDKGLTPSISSISTINDIALTGSTLLNEQGKYSTKLNKLESCLLLMLQGKKLEYSLDIPISKHKENNPIQSNTLSLNANNVKTKTKTHYINGKFNFIIDTNMYVMLTALPSSYESITSIPKLEENINKELKLQFEHLIKKIQKRKLDPIGLGLYARAYQNNEYNKVKSDWGEALKKSNIKVSVHVKVKTMGAVK